VTVTVPRATLIRVDQRWRVVSATTNTGCPPSSADDVFVVRPDGSIVEARSSGLANRRWVDDGTGVYRPPGGRGSG
jgi:hypothetical protein